MGNPFTGFHKSNENKGIASERLARSALMPLREKLQLWQRKAAHLHGDCFDMAARHQSCEPLYAEARELAKTAAGEMEWARQHFAAHRSTSRFADLELHFARLMASLRHLVGDA